MLDHACQVVADDVVSWLVVLVGLEDSSPRLTTAAETRLVRVARASKYFMVEFWGNRPRATVQRLETSFELGLTMSELGK